MSCPPETRRAWCLAPPAAGQRSSTRSPAASRRDCPRPQTSWAPRPSRPSAVCNAITPSPSSKQLIKYQPPCTLGYEWFGVNFGKPSVNEVLLFHRQGEAFSYLQPVMNAVLLHSGGRTVNQTLLKSTLYPNFGKTYIYLSGFIWRIYFTEYRVRFLYIHFRRTNIVFF